MSTQNTQLVMVNLCLRCPENSDLNDLALVLAQLLRANPSAYWSEFGITCPDNKGMTVHGGMGDLPVVS